MVEAGRSSSAAPSGGSLVATSIFLLHAMGVVRVPAVLEGRQLLDGVVVLGAEVLLVEVTARGAALVWKQDR